MFKLTNLTTKQWLCTIVISLMPIVLMEVQKLCNGFMFGKVVHPSETSEEHEGKRFGLS